MRKYPSLNEALDADTEITLTLDDDDAPTYHVNGNLLEDGNLYSE